MEKAKILVIDDDADSLASVVAALRRDGYDVVAAADPREGLARLSSDGADVVLTDLRITSYNVCYTKLLRLRHLFGRKLLPVLPDRLLRVVDQGIQLVARFDRRFPLPVLLGMKIGLPDHLVDLLLRKAGRRGDRDLLLAAGGRILRVDVQDPVRIDVEGDFDLSYNFV